MAVTIRAACLASLVLANLLLPALMVWFALFLVLMRPCGAGTQTA